jgi:putative endonuclease
MFTVYVLYSPSFSKIYIGFTSNLEERIKSHNELGKKGWAIKYRPWEIVHIEKFLEKKDAQRREKELKGAKGRNWIWSLIQKKISEGLISA